MNKITKYHKIKLTAKILSSIHCSYSCKYHEENQFGCHQCFLPLALNQPKRKNIIKKTISFCKTPKLYRTKLCKKIFKTGRKQ
jgi:hypothetical protein